jgi:hypothetical protein
MKAITICQPWAWAIVAGIKAVENRTWSTPHRGTLLIHAGRSKEWLAAGIRDIQRAGLDVPDDLVFGALLGSVRLVDCRPIRQLPSQYVDLFAEGPICWVVDRPRLLLEPIGMAGKPGLFDVPERVLRTALWEPQCRVCGCTQDHACRPFHPSAREGFSAPCYWVEADLCSVCAETVQGPRFKIHCH